MPYVDQLRQRLSASQSDVESAVGAAHARGLMDHDHPLLAAVQHSIAHLFAACVDVARDLEELHESGDCYLLGSDDPDSRFDRLARRLVSHPGMSVPKMLISIGGLLQAISNELPQCGWPDGEVSENTGRLVAIAVEAGCAVSAELLALVNDASADAAGSPTSP